jgi:hypothetical protein
MLFAVLLLVLLGVEATCPHCNGGIPSCEWSTSKTCPSIELVSKNVTIIAAGVGALSLAGLLKPRFMRIFSLVSFDTILYLVKRSAPGTAFSIDGSTQAPAILTAIQNGRLSMQDAVLKLCDLVEQATEEEDIRKLTRRLECLKTACDVQAKISGASANFTGLFETGILTFMWARVSEFVMKKDMQVKLNLDILGHKSDSTSSSMQARIMRPSYMSQFAEMINLWMMYLHSLGVANVLILMDFMEHCVFDTIRARGERWQFAHELMLVMFRRIEDSGGAVTLSNAVDESYLNTVMEEARANTSAFFRTDGGIPGNDATKSEGHKTKSWNGKFTPTSSGCCRYFNSNGLHTADSLLDDGTCKYSHSCDKWIKGHGKDARCKGAHPRSKCTHPDKCDERPTA